jgi:hypothetical protein
MPACGDARRELPGFGSPEMAPGHDGLLRSATNTRWLFKQPGSAWVRRPVQRVAPAPSLLGAHLGSPFALEGEDLGISRIRVAPRQIGVQPPGLQLGMTL